MMQNILEMCDGEVRATDIYCKLAVIPEFVADWDSERFPGSWNLRVRNKQQPDLWFAVYELEPNMLTTMAWTNSGAVFCETQSKKNHFDVGHLVAELTCLAKHE